MKHNNIERKFIENYIYSQEIDVFLKIFLILSKTERLK